MPTIDKLKTKLKEYQDAAQACRANAQNHTNLAVANDGAAQAISLLIADMEKEASEAPTP